jgi:8-hydroxy-5-deazaflavin:NADPH oxidoreductase
MRIGIVGAGMIGSTLAKLWVDAGHEVRLASRHPEELQPLVTQLGKRATAGTPADAATFGEVVMLTVPLKAIPELSRELGTLLAGKVVLDTGNAYEKRDGQRCQSIHGCTSKRSLTARFGLPICERRQSVCKMRLM